MIPSSQSRPSEIGSTKTSRPRPLVSHVLSSGHPPQAGKNKSNSRSGKSVAPSMPACPLCQHNHALHQCPRFLTYSPRQRLDAVTLLRRRYNCLSGNHKTNECLSPRRCRLCAGTHHTLLHNSSESESLSDTHTPSAEGSSTKAAQTVTSHTVAQSTATVLLATARVHLSTPQGRGTTVRALLDQGSAATLISEKIAQVLRVKRQSSPLCVAGIDGTRTTARGTTIINISQDARSKPVYTTTAIILASLTQYRPESVPCSKTWRHTRGLQLADPDPFGSDPIDLIIGADLYGQILSDGQRRGKSDEPTAQNTSFGWILSGRVSPSQFDSVVSSYHTTLETLDQQLRRFWEIEDVPTNRQLCPDDQKCEDHFNRTHTRTEQGCYIVRFPFKSAKSVNLGDSSSMAKASLLRLERKLSADVDHHAAYATFMKEYEDLGHMTRQAPGDASLSSGHYYIPHHAVWRHSSVTTKLRVVFNASAVTTNGHSLNHFLWAGPKLQTDLSAILLAWRQHRVVLADIEKMYRQILMDNRDVDYQRILWRPTTSEPIAEYQLRTVTYGTTSAPFLALRVLKQLMEDEGTRYPLAVTVLRDHTYVDDCIFGADTPESAVEIREQLTALLKCEGFRLRKWASNCSQLLEQVDPENHGLACGKDLSPDDTLQILGIFWNLGRDVLQFRTALPADSGTTKRKILSTISRFYDPLGWVTPVLIIVKMMMQRLWTLKCGWDEPVPESLKTEWTSLHSKLPALEGLVIPRWTGFSPGCGRYELHAFADASTKAYTAVMYLRSIQHSGISTVKLLIAKSKVAPLKTISLPRLELCAAGLLARLLRGVTTTLTLEGSPIYCWTDSTIVLAWLNQPPSRWKTFVGNRVAQIQDLTSGAVWRHVPTHHNPADCASRGLSPEEIIKHPLWWSGPAWLQGNSSSWPEIWSGCDKNAQLEEKPIRYLHSISISEPWDLQHRFFSWSKLLRVTAFVLRFVNKLRRTQRRVLDRSETGISESPLSLRENEIDEAKCYWLRSIQRDVFGAELNSLRHGQLVAASSTISSLNPYLDSTGLLRVEGRLRHAPINKEGKHTVLLKSHSLVARLIEHHHQRALHARPQLTLASLRHEYWILRARTAVRAVLHRCVPCARARAAVPTELMGQLPRFRVTRSERAFVHTGIDYAGPIAVRTSSGRGHQSHKAYIALFICLTIKAIHLELVSNYSSAAFLAAYTRFASRRGLPKAIYSDNGTTFQGADKELRAAYNQALRNPDFINQIATAGVQWHFLPPSAPHFGGLWEAGVKSVKHHLKRCIGIQTLTFEEMTTLLCRVEACLNSRPISAISDSIDDYRPLTPGHFLIGAPLLSPPEPSLLHLKEQRMSRWQLVQRTTEDFWRAWSSDYVSTLQQRPKWRVAQRLAKIGQIVLLRNAHLSPSQWELGQITTCHPGDDGLTRVVTVKTSRSSYVRPISKLCFLPVALSDTDQPESDLDTTTPTSSTTL